MRSEIKHITYSFCFLCILLLLLPLAGIIAPFLVWLGFPTGIFTLQRELFGQLWPYASLLFALLLALLGLRFPARSHSLHSAYLLSIISFLLIFESFGLFHQHPLYSFVNTWNFGVKLLLQDSFKISISLEGFLPLAIFAFWAPALMILILPAERFPLLHWLFCFILLTFSILHIAASLFLQFYVAGLIFSILILPATAYHMTHLLQLSQKKEVLGLVLSGLFYLLLLFLLILISHSGVLFQGISPRQLDTIYLPSTKDMVEAQMFNYAIFFLWLSFSLLFLFLFPHDEQ